MTGEPGTSGEVFVVDDNPNNLNLLAGILRDHGFRVRMVNDGQRAVEMIRARLPELVLLDITMPAPDGYEVCRQLKADPATAAVPVLFISALDDPVDKVKAFALGGVDYVPKPFQAEEVMARVRTHLTIGRLQRQLEERSRRLEEALRSLEEVSRTDPLTGLRNRRFLLEHIDARVSACLESHRTEGRPSHDLLFLLLDLDHFKQVNDTFGHAAGDAVLAQVGERLRQACDANDLLVRWGGEEFLIVALAPPREGGEERAERVRALVSGEAFVIDGGHHVERTCSVGFARLPFIAGQGEALGWGDVIGAADAALYAAKRAGRNAWVGLTAGTNVGAETLKRVFPSWPQAAVRSGSLEVSTNLDREAVIAALDQQRI